MTCQNTYLKVLSFISNKTNVSIKLNGIYYLSDKCVSDEE